MYYFVLAVLVLLLSSLWMFPIAVFQFLLRLLVFFSPFKQKSIRLEDGKHCAYVEKGCKKSSKVTVLLLHGFTASYVAYLELGKMFPKSYHVIAVDWLNHGNSTQIKQLVTVEDVVNFIHMFVKEAGLFSRKLHIVGHSTGGFVAVHYAIKHPQECASISLLSPLGVLTNVVLELNSFCSPKNNKEFEELLSIVYNGKPKMLPPILMNAARLHRCSMAESHVQVYNGFIKDAKFSTDDMKKISDIPSILIWGDNDRLLPSDVGIKFFKEHSQQTEIHILKGSGHMIIETDVKKVHDLLNCWFEKNSV
ncbi:monoacylglycerol lipase abhd6-B isoform X1 [Hydra vulgaris]|uniref:monoacylglycerol lipase abhd6-B isoform X1 n=1 Tax=Hydra vulgaris TaxID=6087 RepID=UPI0002B480C5|nr:monoacylglycerol lipase abhd6-B-like [Hydra vulgaris]